MPLPFEQPRAVAEIDTAALARNYAALRNACGKIIAVVKANAYGHTLPLAVPPLLAAGCDFFAVASAEEALAVRAFAPDAEILLLGYAPLDAVVALARAHITLCAFSPAFAAALSAAAERASLTLAVHLKIDCGMCRLGFAPEERSAVLQAIALPHLSVRGIFTHFPCADTDPEGTRHALTRFNTLRAALPVPLFAHAAASGAALTLPKSHLDAVRVGLALYGYPPVKTALSLRPALRVIAPVVQIHRVSAGTPVGYGGDFICARDSLIGTVPLGYADGFFRALTGYRLAVLCEDRVFTAPVIGRVCMDYLMLDLTDIPAKVGETLCVLSDFATAARHAKTVPYELLTAISARVPRRERKVL